MSRDGSGWGKGIAGDGGAGGRDPVGVVGGEEPGEQIISQVVFVFWKQVFNG